ncbi:MAG: hypothetical protein H7Y89_04255 [Steroidobacteraceae bacterium]|nr:hypothetical protein [Steroidobacteraceae bacterium]
MSRATECGDRAPDVQSATEPREDSVQTLWHWFAVGLLLFCWIAEASMCAARGF